MGLTEIEMRLDIDFHHLVDDEYAEDDGHDQHSAPTGGVVAERRKRCNCSASGCSG